MRTARYGGNVGDPGLFGFVGKALGAVSGILPGPLSPIARAVGGVLSPRSISDARQQSAQPRTNPVLLAGGSGVSVGPGGVTIGRWNPPPIPGLSPGGMQGGPLTGQAAANPKPCIAGRHYNKSGYWTKRYGYVAPGTVCVKNRKRNPLNPRALSRSMARIASAQKAVACLGLFQVGPKRQSKPKPFGKRKCKTGCK
jgi:hypothetical protein